MFRYAVPSTNEKPISDVLGHSDHTAHAAVKALCYAHDYAQLIDRVYILIGEHVAIKVLHKLPRVYVKVLRTAAMLHDTGNRVKYYDHQKHSAYIILNSGLYGYPP